MSCLLAASFSLSSLAAAAQNPVQPVAAHASPRVDATYGKLPLSFEPNRGQVDPSVQFLARGSHYNVLLQPTAATLLLNRDDRSAQQPRMHGHAASVTSAAIRMTLEGANAQSAMSPDRELPGYVNYISGDKARTHTGIPTYAAARAAGVYPGIDLVYYGTERQLEYDFIVSPQSDPGQIRLSIAGAHPVVAPNGQLRLQLADKQRDNDIVLRKPVLYQLTGSRRRPVDGSFTLAADGKIGFQVGPYDHDRELVIDPVISYASYFGGAAEDEIYGSALNAANQLYAVGQTRSTSLLKTSGEFQSGPYGGVQVGLDAFVTKFSADGSTVLWTTYLAGSGDDSAHAVAVNSSDQAYVVGDTDSCIYPSEAEPNQNYDPNGALPIVRFPFTSDAVQTLCSPAAGSHNAEVDGTNTTVFLVKLSSDGTTELYGTPIGGSNGDYASSIVLDATGRPYIVGETNSTGYYKCIGAPGDCDVPAYPVDQHGNADYGTANFPTTANAAFSNVSLAVQYDTTDNSGNVSGPAIEQAFITVLSADLHSFVYSSLIGGGVLGYCGNGLCNTYGNAVAVNAAGQAFIGGETSSAHWPVTTGAFAASCPNAGAATSTCNLTGWLAGFDPSKSGAASLLFSTYMTGSSAGLDSNGNSINTASDVYGLAVDASGNVVATGDTNADNFPTTAGTFEPACTQFSGGGSTKLCQSAYITKLSPAGATVWSTYYTPLTSPGNPVVGQGVALDASGNVFVVGTSTASTLPLVKTLTTNGAQYNDAFVIELSPTGASLLMGTYLGSGGGISLDNNSLHLDTSLNAYFTGYQGYNNYGGTSFPVTSNAPQPNLQGTDGWVVKLITQQQVSSTALQLTPSSGTPGTSISFTATVTGLPTFATPTGTVTLTNGSTTLGTITLANGTGTFSTTTLAAGTYSVIATYSGDVVYATSASTAQPLAILNTPTVVLAATPTSATLGTAVALKATVSSSAGTPTGTVYFLDGTTTLGSAVLSGGVANYSATALAVGTHSITARYGGDTNFSTLTSSPQTVTITAPPPSISAVFSPASLTITHGSTASSTLTVTPANGFAGTLTFSCGSLPSSASCGFAPTSLTFTANSSAAQSTVVTVSTNASIIGALHPAPFAPRGGNQRAIVFACLLLPLAFTRRCRKAIRNHAFITLGLLLLSLAGLSALSGCSSTSSPATTPVGSYTVAVTVTGAPSATVLNLPITVQ